MIHQSGQQTADILPDMINSVIADFPWPKSQRWGRGEMSWVRPLHRINVLLDGKSVAGQYDLGGGAVIITGISAMVTVFLHLRILIWSDGKTLPLHMMNYWNAHFVMAHRDTRRSMIAQQIDDLATSANMRVLDDDGLLDEVTGLVEWPHAIMGQIDDDYMSLPKDILVLTMRSHQKYFALTHADGSLAPAFITISNMHPDKTRDAMIRKGNERVLRARLSDARFLWDQDRATTLD